MLAPNRELGFAFSDLYPNMKGLDTSNLAVPEADDLEALHEDVETSEKASGQTSGKQIFIALGIMLGIVVFLGSKG